MTVTATLDNPAKSDVTVRLFRVGGSVATLADFTLPAPFMISTGATSADATIVIVDDAVDEQDEDMVIGARAGNLSSAALTVTISDDDTAGVSVSETTRTVTGARSATYTVLLDTQPTRPVTLTPASAATGTVTVATANSDNVLTFTTNNYSTAQTVTVTGVAAGSASVTHTAASRDPKYNNISVADVAVTVDAPFVVSAATVTVQEPGTVEYTLKLAVAPTHSVTVTPASAATGVATVSGPLTFTATNWDTTQAVTVTGVAEGVTSVTHTSASDDSDYSISTGAAAVAVTVTPAPGLRFSTESVVAVGTGTVTYTVKLATAPTADVTVTPTSADIDKATASTANGDDRLTFTATNWDTTQAVTVTGVTTGTTSVTHASASDDSVYAIAAAGSVGVTVSTAPALLFNTTTVTAVGTGTVTYTVKLATAPTADVTVTATSEADAVATVSAAVTFTTSNWDTVQTFTVTGVTTGTTSVTHTATSAGDAGYRIAAAGSVGVTVNPRVLVIDADSLLLLGVGEANEAQYQIRLASRPDNQVIVTITSADEEIATVTGSRTFMSTDWNEAQTVTVTGVATGVVSVTHSVSSSDTDFAYDTAGTVAVSVAAPVSPDTLVGNAGQAGQGIYNVGGSTGNRRTVSQPFTTGRHVFGYTLTAVDVRFFNSLASSSDASNIAVELWTDSSGEPGAKLADLTVPSHIPKAWVTFTAPAGTVLRPATIYHVVVDAMGATDTQLTIHLTTGGVEDAGAAPGFSIADNALRNGDEGWVDATNAQDAAFVRVRGRANSEDPDFSLVSNLSQQQAVEGWTLTTGGKVSGAFTTGAHGSGYTLTSIEVDLETSGSGLSAADRVALKAEVWTDSSGDPGSKVATLTIPSAVSTGVVTFTAPAGGVSLDSSTVYHFLLDGTSITTGPELQITASDDEDVDSFSDWSIADAFRFFSTGSWGTDSSANMIAFAVKGTLNDPTDLASLTAATSTDGSTFTGTLALTPTFDAAVTVYAGSVPNNVTHVQVTPTLADATSVVKVGLGSSLATVASGSASAALALTVGSNTVNVEVTSADGSITKTYAVTVTRRAAVTAGTVHIWSVTPQDKALTVHVDRAVGVCYGGVRVRVKDTDLATMGSQPGPWREFDSLRLADGVCDTRSSVRVSYARPALVNGQTYEVQAIGVIDAADSYTPWSASADGTPEGMVADAVSLIALTGVTSTDGSDFTAGALTLNPAFGEDNEFYSVAVAGSVTHIKLTPTVKTTGATVTVGRKGATAAAVTSGSASGALALRPGYDDYEVKVTSGSDTQTYTLRVVRLVTPTITAAPAVLNGKPAISYTVPASRVRAGYTTAIQIKKADESWPARDAGPSVTSGSIDGGGQIYDTADNPLRFGSLKKNTAYHVRAHWVDGSGTVVDVSLPLEASSSQVAVTTWDLPGAPTAVTATAASATSLSVGWTAPTTTGGSGLSISGYRVRWRVADADLSRGRCSAR